MKQFKIKVENNKEFRAITLLDSNDKEVTLDDIISSVVDGATIGTDKPVRLFDGYKKLNFNGVRSSYREEDARKFLYEGVVEVSYGYKEMNVKFEEEKYEIGTLNNQIADRIKRVIDVAKELKKEVANETGVIITPLCFE